MQMERFDECLLLSSIHFSVKQRGFINSIYFWWCIFTKYRLYFSTVLFIRFV